MDYFFLRTDAHFGPEVAFFDEDPAEFDGIGFMWRDGESLKSEWPRSASIKMGGDLKGIEVLDVVPNVASMLLVSAAVQSILRSVINAKAHPTEFLPLAILNHKGRVASDEHALINPLGALDALDQDQSKIKRLRDRVISVKKFVLSEAKIPKTAHLFRLQEHSRRYVVSQKLAEALQTADPELRGIQLEKIEIVRK